MSRAGVVGPNTLLGRELRERLDQRSELVSEVRLLSADEDEIGQLAESGGAAAFVARLDENAFDGLDVVFFCGEIEADRPWIQRLPETARGIVLSSGATSADAAPALAGRGGLDDAALLAMHPAAYGTAALLARLDPFTPRSAQAVAILPVSLHGEAGIDALFEQTRAVLAFQSPKRGPLQSQRAFNVALSATDADDVARQIAASVGAAYPVSAQLIEAGVFHGVGLSLRVELAEEAAARDVRKALGGDPRVELARQPAGVSPVALAGAERIVVGEVRPGADGRTLWIWAAWDNVLRGGALAAIELAEDILGGATPPS